MFDGRQTPCYSVGSLWACPAHVQHSAFYLSAVYLVNTVRERFKLEKLVYLTVTSDSSLLYDELRPRTPAGGSRHCPGLARLLQPRAVLVTWLGRTHRRRGYPTDLAAHSVTVWSPANQHSCQDKQQWVQHRTLRSPGYTSLGRVTLIKRGLDLSSSKVEVGPTPLRTVTSRLLLPNRIHSAMRKPLYSNRLRNLGWRSRNKGIGSMGAKAFVSGKERRTWLEDATQRFILTAPSVNPNKKFGTVLSLIKVDEGVNNVCIGLYQFISRGRAAQTIAQH
ncbi:hypothetical protein J6590_010308 [Homalodisca vitripennis]|nr:hypothetical protein J6590_010308 [Homalodisca vitripennis]